MRAKQKQSKQLLVMILGTFLLAFSYYHINFQNNLTEGGFMGLALLGKFAFNISPTLTMLALDIPIFILALFLKGRKFLMNTMIAATAFTVFYEICDRFSPLVFDMHQYMPIAAILSGITTGFGAGIVLRYGGATGGDDILTLFLSKFTGLSVGTVFLIIDLVVLGLSLLYLPLMATLYTVLAVSISARIITWVVEYGRRDRESVTA
ncbi:YitT family protein [Brevibacillus fluminis]|uniref:YitT family protein n=1 Tax=Brevibacillus fluminis TaxID=511487 RepID=UPI003F897C7C